MPLERVSQGFKDISMSFKFNPLNGDLIALKNANAISRSIRNIVFTTPGEKFFNEDFGSDVSRSLFENIDDLTASNIRDQIRRSIINFEERVDLREVVVLVYEVVVVGVEDLTIDPLPPSLTRFPFG